MKIYLFILFIISLSTELISQLDTTIYDRFTSTYIDFNGYKINIETLGTGDPIFFFAGGPGNSHDYMQGNFGHYYTTHQVVFIDMLGRGLSDDAKDKSEYSVENDVELAEHIRQYLGLGKIGLVGHSYGTVVAQAYALKYPKHVSKMLLISGFHSGAMWQANCDSYNHYTKTHFPEKWEIVDSLRALGYISSDPELRSVYGSFPTKYMYYHDTSLKNKRPLTSYRSWNNDVYVSIIGRDGDFDVSGSMINQDFRSELKDLDIPTLIMAGRYDGVSTPEYNIQYKLFMPQAKFVMFENSGHNPYLEEPDKFFKLMDELFR